MHVRTGTWGKAAKSHDPVNQVQTSQSELDKLTRQGITAPTHLPTPNVRALSMALATLVTMAVTLGGHGQIKTGSEAGLHIIALWALNLRSCPDCLCPRYTESRSPSRRCPVGGGVSQGCS